MQLEDVLRDEKWQSAFMSFLKSEFSSENLEFWLQCQQFKKLKNKKQLKKQSEQIYAKFIAPNGSNTVNIDQSAAKSVEEYLKNPHPDMFAIAEAQIFQLMRIDSFSRFCKSDFCKQYQSTLVDRANIHEDTCSQTAEEKFLSRKRKRTNECDNLPTTGQLSISSTETVPKICDNDLDQRMPNFDHHHYRTSMTPNNARQRRDDERSSKKIQYQNLFHHSELEHCDSESLRCNAPIYSFDASPESTSLRRSSQKRWFNNRYIRVVFHDRSEEFIYTAQKATIRQLIDRLLQKKSLRFSSYRIFSLQTNESIDLDQEISSIALNDIRIEQRINFSIHFPEGYRVNVETAPNQIAFFVIKRVLSHFGIVWRDIELNDQCENILDESALMKQSFDIDERTLYVNYLSSLRTYLNLNVINNLNDDDNDLVVIKSIQFAAHKRSLASSSSSSSARYKTRGQEKSCSTLIIDANNRSQNRDNDYRQPPLESLKTNDCDPIHTYTNVQQPNNDSNDDVDHRKNIDLCELSFSNDNATENFLTEIMTTDVSRLNFVCSPKSLKNKKSKQTHHNHNNNNEQHQHLHNNNVNGKNEFEHHLYENMLPRSDPESFPSIDEIGKRTKSPETLHKARYVIVDDHEYANYGSSNDKFIQQHQIGSLPTAMTKQSTTNQQLPYKLDANQEIACDCATFEKNILISKKKVEKKILMPRCPNQAAATTTLETNNCFRPPPINMMMKTKIAQNVGINLRESQNHKPISCQSPISFAKYLLPPSSSSSSSSSSPTTRQKLVINRPIESSSSSRSSGGTTPITKRINQIALSSANKNMNTMLNAAKSASKKAKRPDLLESSIAIDHRKSGGMRTLSRFHKIV